MSTWGSYQALFPTWYKARLPERSYQQLIIVDWLQREVPAQACLSPKVEKLSHWRNIEVYHYVKYELPDWTAKAY